jgi:hypothetical protein
LHGRSFSSRGALGTLLNAGALIDACLVTHWLANEPGTMPGFVVAEESFGVRGAGLAVLGAVAARAVGA